MRLIDADALIEFLNKNWYGDVMEVIKNAQTVIPDNDIFEWCTDCKEYDQEKYCCHRWSSKIRETIEEIKQYKLDELRPKGEWIYKKFDEETGISNSYFCSECGCPQGQVYINFCGQCGASMKGVQNERHNN